MNSLLGQWIEDNAELFRYTPDVLALKPKADKILLSGGVSACLSGVYRTLYQSSEIVAVDDNKKLLEDGKSECDSLICIDSPFNTFCSNDEYDIAVSLLAIQSLNTRELTPYLYNLYDSLKSGGCLYLSFPDAVSITTMEKNLYPAWYSDKEMVYMKYYMAEDVIRALDLIGFEVKAIESDNNSDLIHVVSLLCIKR